MKDDYKNTLINTGKILNAGKGGFDTLAIEIFHYQYAHNTLYRQYCDALNINKTAVLTPLQIPFLPISFFKTHEVKTGGWQAPALLFESSGTTGSVNSKHYVHDAGLYEDALLKGFVQYYGHPSEYALLALLPSYLERKNASLAYMAKTLMEQGSHTGSGFYINEWEALHSQIIRLDSAGQKVILLGVTFALIDFAMAYPGALGNTIVMETGGMKGKREEWTRQQVHSLLKTQWQLSAIHSE